MPFTTFVRAGLAALACVLPMAAHAQSMDNVALPAAQTQPFGASSYPRRIERGDVLLEQVSTYEAGQRFNDAAAREEALLPFRLLSGSQVYCGAAVANAAAAARLSNILPPPKSCFQDTDNDGAADRRMPVAQESGGVMILASGETIAPRAWTATQPLVRRARLSYGGPQMGDISAEGIVVDGFVEVLASRTDGDGTPIESPQTMLCLQDGRCGPPLPVSADQALILFRPTVDGYVEVKLISRTEAQALDEAIQSAARAMRDADQQRRAATRR